MPSKSKSKSVKKPRKKSRKDIVLVELPAGGAFPSIGAYSRAGSDRRTESDWAKSRDEAGRLRGGSVGCVLPGEEFEYTGNCLRASAARFLGADPPRDQEKWRNTRLMFDAGLQSEVDFTESLRLGLPPGYRLVRDFALGEAIGGAAGAPLTGREDVAIVDAAGKPVCLIELKNVSSLPVDLLFDEMPKLDNLIQVGNYARLAGCPAQLWYTSRTIHSLPTQWKWVAEKLPESPDDGTPGVEHVEFSAPMYGRGGLPTKIRPFTIGFHIRWATDGDTRRLYYSRASDSDPHHEPEVWAPTPITEAGIVAYYEAVLQTVNSTCLPPPPVVLQADGAKKNFVACRYCDWNSTCQAVGASHQDWKEAVLNQVAPPEITQVDAPASTAQQGESK